MKRLLRVALHVVAVASLLLACDEPDEIVVAPTDPVGPTATEPVVRLVTTAGAAKTMSIVWPAGAAGLRYQLWHAAAGQGELRMVADDIVGTLGESNRYWYTFPLNSHMALGDVYAIAACDAEPCTRLPAVEVTSSVLTNGIGYLKGVSTASGDRLGEAVAISADGQWLALGAPGDASGATGVNGEPTTPGSPRIGAVFMYRRFAGAWYFTAYLKPPEATTDYGFGRALAFNNSGKVLAVSAWGPAASPGVVHVFCNVDGWQMCGDITPSHGDAHDGFGDDLALSGDGQVLLVGASNEASIASTINGDEADNAAQGSGAAYVFRRDGEGAWHQEAYMKAWNNRVHQRGAALVAPRFGARVAMDEAGTRIAIAAPGESNHRAGINAETDGNYELDLSGAVYLFELTEGGWVGRHYIKAQAPVADGQYGTGLGLSANGGTLLIAASVFADQGLGGLGAQLYAWQAETLERGAVLVPAKHDRFSVGSHARLSGDGRVAVLASEHEQATQTGVLAPAALRDQFAPGAGAAAVFTLGEVTQTWTQRSVVKAPNAEAGDRFGRALALSSDGTTLLIGAPFESSSARGVGGAQANNALDAAGAVYLY